MIKFNLDKSLEIIGYSMNKLSLLAEVRPNTINDLVNGKAKRIEIETVDKILNAMNEVAALKRINKQFNMADIIEHIPDNGHVVLENVSQPMNLETYKKIKEILSLREVQTDIPGIESTNCLELMSLYEDLLTKGIYNPTFFNSRFTNVSNVLWGIGPYLQDYGLIDFQKDAIKHDLLKFSEKGKYFMSLLRNDN